MAVKLVSDNDAFEERMLNLDTNPRIIMGKFILDDNNNPVPVTSLSEWGQWMEESGNYVKRILGRTFLQSKPDIYVSTVFLGIDHAFRLDPDEAHHDAVLWETMVFGGELDGDQERYITRNDAIEGHQRMVTRVNATIERRKLWIISQRIGLLLETGLDALKKMMKNVSTSIRSIAN